VTEPARPDPHEQDDGSFAYGGRIVTGKEAAYLRAAMGHAVRATQGPSSRLTRDESVALLAAQLARDGIDFSQWTHWTLDQMDLYLEGRSLRVEQVNDEIRSMEANAKANKADILLRYVVPLD
jgi:hypothetical protein